MLLERQSLMAVRAGRILRSPLPSDLKRKILWTHLALHGPPRRARNSRSPVARTVAGYAVKAYSRDALEFLFTEIFVELAYLFRAGRVPPHIVDCGSNIGLSILFFKLLYPEATVVGFEPEASSFRLLSENVASNGLRGVVLHNVALGDRDGEVDLFVDRDDPGSAWASVVPGRTSPHATKVAQARLSRFIERDVDLLKLDVEGAEDSILQELIVSGAIARIDQMIVEYHHHIDPARDALGPFLETLEHAGFGYQLGAIRDPVLTRAGRPFFQDVQIHAYRKR